jgi:heme O synthase-like polyprenyltransferase
VALIVRLILFAVIATIGVSLVAYVFTKQRRYLSFAWSTFKFSVLFLLALALLLILERVIMAL